MHITPAKSRKTQQSAVILDLCLRKTWSGKYHDYRDRIIFEECLELRSLRPLVTQPAATPPEIGIDILFIGRCDFDFGQSGSGRTDQRLSGVVTSISGGVAASGVTSGRSDRLSFRTAPITK